MFCFHEYDNKKKGKKIRWNDKIKKFILYKIGAVTDTEISEANENKICFNDIIYEKRTYKNGLLDGPQRTYRKNDTTIVLEDYKNGLRDGYSLRYYKNSNNLKRKLFYKSGKNDGEQFIYHKNGALKTKSIHKFGKPVVKQHYDICSRGELIYTQYYSKNGMRSYLDYKGKLTTDDGSMSDFRKNMRERDKIQKKYGLLVGEKNYEEYCKDPKAFMVKKELIKQEKERKEKEKLAKKRLKKCTPTLNPPYEIPQKFLIQRPLWKTEKAIKECYNSEMAIPSNLSCMLKYKDLNDEELLFDIGNLYNQGFGSNDNRPNLKEGMKYISKAARLGQPDAIYSYGIHLCQNKMYKIAEKFVNQVSDKKIKGYFIKHCKNTNIGTSKKLIKEYLNDLADINNSRNNNKKYLNLLLHKSCNEKQISQKLYNGYLKILKNKKADEF